MNGEYGSPLGNGMVRSIRYERSPQRSSAPVPVKFTVCVSGNDGLNTSQSSTSRRKGA